MCWILKVETSDAAAQLRSIFSTYRGDMLRRASLACCSAAPTLRGLLLIYLQERDRM